MAKDKHEHGQFSVFITAIISLGPAVTALGGTLLSDANALRSRGCAARVFLVQ